MPMIVALFACVFACGAAPQGHVSAPFSVEVGVPFAPRVASFEAGRALVFELLIRNTGTEPVFIDYATLDAAPYSWSAGRGLCDVVGRYPEIDADTLSDLRGIRERMAEDAALAPCSIPPGRAVFVPFWGVATTTETTPESISASVRLRVGTRTEDYTVETPIAEQSVLILGPPVRGHAWLVSNGLARDAGHRSTALRMHGQPHWAQRFAADFSALDEAGCVIPEGATFLENTRYFGYGTEVLAVADARVARVLDGIPENVPGAHAIAITVDTVTGNAVWLALSDDRYAFYAHLIQGSIVVREGDVVHRGDVLGRLGNSGNSTSPHLHFHVARGLGGLDTEGVPYVFERFSTRSALLPDSLFDTERCVDLEDDERELTHVLPSLDAVVRFE